MDIRSIHVRFGGPSVMFACMCVLYINALFSLQFIIAANAWTVGHITFIIYIYNVFVLVCCMYLCGTSTDINIAMKVLYINSRMKKSLWCLSTEGIVIEQKQKSNMYAEKTNENPHWVCMHDYKKYKIHIIHLMEHIFPIFIRWTQTN